MTNTARCTTKMNKRTVKVEVLTLGHATRFILALFAWLGVATCLHAAETDSKTSTWSLSGDLRTGYTASWRDSRTGQSSNDDNVRARARVRLSRKFAGRWQVSTRIGGSYASDQDGFDVYLRHHRPGPTSVNPGDTTLDEFVLSYTNP